MNCEGFGPATGVDPGCLEAPAHSVRRKSEAAGQSVPQCLSPLGEPRAHDGVEAVLIENVDPRG